MEYYIGVDIRFKKSAVVVVVSDKPPEAETMRQMVGRGTRDWGKKEGYLFYTGNKDDKGYEREKIMSTNGPDFKDAAIIIKALLKMRVS